MIMIKIPEDIVEQGYIPTEYGPLNVGDAFLDNEGIIRKATKCYVGMLFLRLEKKPNNLGNLEIGDEFKCSVFKEQVCTKVALNLVPANVNMFKFSAFIVGCTVEVYENTLEVTKL